MFSSSFCEHELTFLVNEWIPRIVEFTDIKHYEAYELLSLKFDSVVYTYYFLGQYFDISFKKSVPILKITHCDSTDAIVNYDFKVSNTKISTKCCKIVFQNF